MRQHDALAKLLERFRKLLAWGEGEDFASPKKPVIKRRAVYFPAEGLICQQIFR